jgi:Phosphopantetheinyl transferase
MRLRRFRHDGSKVRYRIGEVKELLGTGEAHLWCFRPQKLNDGRLLRAGLSFLSADERARLDRFLVPEPRHVFLCTRLLVRSVLSLYADVEPWEWIFQTNQYGRPEIASPTEYRPLRFNLSNKKGLIVCLVAWDGDLGVDVEDTSQPPRRLLEIADRFFSPREAAALRALPSKEEQRSRFYHYWTLKESYIKARGVGLALGLSGFSFLFERGRIRITYEPGFVDSQEWDFQLLQVDDRHVIGVTLERHKLSNKQLLLRNAEEAVFHELRRAGGISSAGAL